MSNPRAVLTRLSEEPEALKMYLLTAVPIHMLFTMPWTPTGAFPHPMARALMILL